MGFSGICKKRKWTKVWSKYFVTISKAYFTAFREFYSNFVKVLQHGSIHFIPMQTCSHYFAAPILLGFHKTEFLQNKTIFFAKKYWVLKGWEVPLK